MNNKEYFWTLAGIALLVFAAFAGLALIIWAEGQ